MRAIKAHFDGEKVIVPDEVNGFPPGDVILIFQDPEEEASDRQSWVKAQETAFEQVWNNDEDAIYDTL